MPGNNPTYSPNLGVLSGVQGMAEGFSEVGKMGLMDAMETRRSKMEHELRLQLKGEDQDFSTGQADIEDERKVEAATVKHGRDIELEGAKAAAKSKTGKDSDKFELTTADGTPLKYDDVRKAWSNQVGADLETFDPNAAMTFENYLDERGIRYRNAPAPKPIKPVTLDESTYRERYKQQRPDAPQEEIDAAVQKNRDAGKITGDVSSPAMEPGIMDAMAADVDQTAGNGQFAGGAPQGKPGVLAEIEEDVAPNTDYAKMGQAMEAERVSSAQRGTIQDKLLKHRSKAAKPSARQVGRKAAKKDADKVQKAATMVEAALKKGNINQISKDRLKFALNNQSFVDGLSEEEMQTLVDYLEQR